MRRDFSGKDFNEKPENYSDDSFASSNISDNGDVHRETKIAIGEKIFELLRLICH